MKMGIYNFLVNRHAGIKQRYHRFHDNAHGISKMLSWAYLLWLNFAYYILFCRFLGKIHEMEIYEDKNLVIGKSESEVFNGEFKEDVDSLISKLESYDYISFDIFDTLIFRPFSEPADLFYFVGEKLGFMNFKRLRMEVEKKTRQSCFKKNGHYEITIDDIWSVMESETGIKKSVGMNIELELERKLCYANPFMKQVFTKLVDMGKHVIVISDMYMPKSALEEILKENGIIGQKELYVSCEYGLNKASGNLYRHVKKEQGFAADADLKKCWIHVGDNVNSDIDRAEKNGISAYYYPNVNRKSALYRPYDMSPVVGSAYRGVVNSHIYNGMCTYSPEYEYGYIYGGLFVLGYCSFIHDYCKKNFLDKVLFLSRDGDILKQVYDYLYPEEETEYIYWSRRAATKLMFEHNKYDYFRRFIYHKVNKQISLAHILGSMELGFLCECLPEELSADEYLTDGNADALRMFIEHHWKDVQEHYKDENTGAYRYFKEKLKGCKNVCAVDIGWAGSGAISISYLVENVWKLDCRVTGIIAGTNTIHNAEPDVSEMFLQNGKLVAYMYSQAHNRDLMKKHDPNKDYNVYWELLLSSPTRQFKGFSYDMAEDRVILHYGEPDKNQEGINEIQRGIRDFVACYNKHFREFSYMYNISGRDAYAPVLVAAGRNERYLKFIEKKFKLEVNVS